MERTYQQKKDKKEIKPAAESNSAQAMQLQDNRPKTVLQQNQTKGNPVQKKSNNTGLPDNLKSGIENLSGHSMNDVKVHYNSSQPAQLNAHAFAQGNQIHIGAGQEKHLPHEAWHVVQQKQGRVKPTKQLKGKTNINDDAGLEKEADMMGAKAIHQFKEPATLINSSSNGKTAQLVIAAGSFQALLAEQKSLEVSVGVENIRASALSQPSEKEPPKFDESKLYEIISKEGLNIPGKEVLPALVGHFIKARKADAEAYTFPETDWNAFSEWLKHEVGNKQVTAGFEFEFSSMAAGNPFAGVTHVELSKSHEQINHLPFTLETDAGNALELVTPPMFLDAIDTDIPLPKPAEAEKVDTLIKARLQEITAEDKTMKAMAEAFKANPGLTFDLHDAKVTPKSLSDRSFGKFTEGKDTVPGGEIENINIGKITKYGHGGIDTQLNIATDAESYATFVELNMTNRDENSYVKQFYDLQHLLETTIKIQQFGGKLKGFLMLFIRNIAGQLAIPSMSKIFEKQQQAFKTGKSEKAKGDLEFEFYAWTSSGVKDVGNIWIKDNIINIGIGMLNQEEWNVVSEIIKQGILQKAIMGLRPPEYLTDKVPETVDERYVGKLIAENRRTVGAYYKEAEQHMLSAIATMGKAIGHFKLNQFPTNKMVVTPQVPFMGHNPNFIGPRQDTHLDPAKVQLPTWKQRLHVSELRSDPINSLKFWVEAAIKNKTSRLDAEKFEKNARPYERYNALLTPKESRDGQIKIDPEDNTANNLTMEEYESIKKRLSNMDLKQRFNAMNKAKDLTWDENKHVAHILANSKEFEKFD